MKSWKKVEQFAVHQQSAVHHSFNPEQQANLQPPTQSGSPLFKTHNTIRKDIIKHFSSVNVVAQTSPLDAAQGCIKVLQSPQNQSLANEKYPSMLAHTQPNLYPNNSNPNSM